MLAGVKNVIFQMTFTTTFQISWKVVMSSCYMYALYVRLFVRRTRSGSRTNIVIFGTKTRRLSNFKCLTMKIWTDVLDLTICTWLNCTYWNVPIYTRDSFIECLEIWYHTLHSGGDWRRLQVKFKKVCHIILEKCSIIERNVLVGRLC